MKKSAQTVIREGACYTIAAANGRVLEVADFNTENGASIRLWSYEGQPWQQWIFEEACRKVALYLLFALCILCRDQRGAVVRKAVEVDRSGFQHRSILCGHIQLYAILLPNAV